MVEVVRPETGCYVILRIGVLLQTLRIDSTGNDGSTGSFGRTRGLRLLPDPDFLGIATGRVEDAQWSLAALEVFRRFHL